MLIQITGLKVHAHHGVFQFERQYGQHFLIDASVWLNPKTAGTNDDLAQTVNYGTLAQLIVEDAKSNPVDLLETLATRLLTKVMQFGGSTITRASITVHKPEAPIDYEFADVSVTVDSSWSTDNDE